MHFFFIPIILLIVLASIVIRLVLLPFRIARWNRFNGYGNGFGGNPYGYGYGWHRGYRRHHGIGHLIFVILILVVLSHLFGHHHHGI